MKTYAYKGFQTSGHPVKGLIEAAGLKNAREKLAEQGVLVEKISPASITDKSALFRSRSDFDLDARSMIYRELSTLLKAGLSLTQSLSLLIEAMENNQVKLAALRDRIQEGDSFANALGAVFQHVRSMEIAAIRAGELSGSLDRILERLAEFLEEQRAVHDRVQTALIYPAIVLSMTLLIALLMFGVMIPRFASLFKEAQIELPAITVGILAAGRFLQYLFATGLAAAICVAVWLKVKAHDRDFRIKLDRILFRIPLWGRGYAGLVNLRFAQTLSLLLDGGVPLIEAFPLAGQATGSLWVSSLTEKEAESLHRHGSTLADAVRRVPPLSEVLPGWIQAGEASGSLPDLLDKAGTRFQMRWQRLINRCLEILEPALIIFVGIIVLVLALAVLSPILSLNSSLM